MLPHRRVQERHAPLRFPYCNESRHRHVPRARHYCRVNLWTPRMGKLTFCQMTCQTSHSLFRLRRTRRHRSEGGDAGGITRGPTALRARLKRLPRKIRHKPRKRTGIQVLSQSERDVDADASAGHARDLPHARMHVRKSRRLIPLAHSHSSSRRHASLPSRLTAWFRSCVSIQGNVLS